MSSLLSNGLIVRLTVAASQGVEGVEGSKQARGDSYPTHAVSHEALTEGAFRSQHIHCRMGATVTHTMQSLQRFITYPSRMFYGWRMVFIGLLINAMGGGIFNQGFAVFFLPITRDLNLSRAQTSLIFSLSRAEGAIEGPISGWLVDKFGPKYILFAGACIAGLGYIVLSQVQSYETFLVVYLLVISLAFNAGFNHPIMSTVNSWFIRKRGMAFGVTLSSFSLGGIIMAPLLSTLVHNIGWRQTVIVAAFMLWAVALPLSLKLVRSPEELGLYPDGDTAPAPRGRRNVTGSGFDFTLKEALKTQAFWWVAVSTTLRLAVINTMNVHFIPVMVWKGVPETNAAFMLGGMACMSLIARLAIGAIGDRFQKQLVIAAGLCLGMAGLLILQYSTATWHLWVYIVSYAVMEGIIPLNWAIIGDYFGRTHFATLRGFMGLVYTWGAIIFPVVAGWIYDTTGSYTNVVWVMLALFVLAAIGFASLRQPKLPERFRATAEEAL